MLRNVYLLFEQRSTIEFLLDAVNSELSEPEHEKTYMREKRVAKAGTGRGSRGTGRGHPATETNFWI